MLGSRLGSGLGSGALALLVVGLIHGDILVITEALIVLVCVRLCLRDKILCLQQSKHFYTAKSQHPDCPGCHVHGLLHVETL